MVRKVCVKLAHGAQHGIKCGAEHKMQKISIFSNFLNMPFFGIFNLFFTKNICLTLFTHAKCGTHSTLCWKVGNISGSTELFAL